MSDQQRTDRHRSIAVGAGLGLIFGAALGATGPGMVLGAAVGLVAGGALQRMLGL